MWPCPRGASPCSRPSVVQDHTLPSVEGPWSARCSFSPLWPPSVGWFIVPVLSVAVVAPTGGPETLCGHLQRQSPSAVVLVQDGVLTSCDTCFYRKMWRPGQRAETKVTQPSRGARLWAVLGIFAGEQAAHAAAVGGHAGGGASAVWVLDLKGLLRQEDGLVLVCVIWEPWGFL